MIKFSLIIPVYNKQNCIRETLETVVNNHELPDSEFECILVNESSTDDSGKICNEYCKKYSYFKCYNIQNDGIKKPANARNFGKSIATGKYIMFLDADDFLCDGFITSVCKFLDVNYEYDFYLCNRYIDSTKYYQIQEQFELFGPSLSCCIFRKEITDILDFENIINEDIVYTEKVILAGYKYYYDFGNECSYIYNTQNSEMIHDDVEKVKIYSDWRAGVVKSLQYYRNYNYCLNDNNEIVLKSTKQIKYIDYLVTDKCNLNCASCSAFCAISDGEILDIETILNDLTLLSRFKDDLKEIIFCGGEPTLHPNLSEILTLARKLFPNNELHILTNGINYKNLYKLRDSIVKNNVNCSLTLYPVKNMLDIKNEFIKLIPKNNLIICEHALNNGFYYKHLMNNRHNETDKIMQCLKREAPRLYKGKLYICHYANGLHILKDRYGNLIRTTDEGSYIEFNENTTLEQINNLKYNCIPDICYHCEDVLQENTTDKMKYWDSYPWRPSERKIEEFYKV